VHWRSLTNYRACLSPPEYFGKSQFTHFWANILKSEKKANPPNEEFVTAARTPKVPKPNPSECAKRHPAESEDVSGRIGVRPIGEQQQRDKDECNASWQKADDREEEELLTLSIILPLLRIHAHLAFSIPFSRKSVDDTGQTTY